MVVVVVVAKTLEIEIWFKRLHNLPHNQCKCKFNVKHRECLRDHPHERLI